MTSKNKRHSDSKDSSAEPSAKRAKNDEATALRSGQATALRSGPLRSGRRCAGCDKVGATVPVDDDRFVKQPRFVCNQHCFGTLIRKTKDEYERKKTKKEDTCAQCKNVSKAELTADGKCFCSDNCKTAHLKTCPSCESTNSGRATDGSGWQCARHGCELSWYLCRIHNYKTPSFEDSSDPTTCDCVQRGATPTTDECVGFLLLKLKESSSRGAKWEEDHLDLLLAHFGQTREQSEKEFRAWLGTPTA